MQAGGSMNDKEIRFIKALRTYYESKQKPAKRLKRKQRHTKIPDRRQEQYAALLDDFDRRFREGKI
jgi:hypothetical protein